MTNKEAAIWLREHIDATPDGTKQSEAIELAIKALEQEPCEDCISREAVMECFKKWQPYIATRLWDYELELKDLPSVTPTSDAECDYESGYNCGYADAIDDMSERSEEDADSN